MDGSGHEPPARFGRRFPPAPGNRTRGRARGFNHRVYNPSGNITLIIIQASHLTAGRLTPKLPRTPPRFGCVLIYDN